MQQILVLNERTAQYSILPLGHKILLATITEALVSKWELGYGVQFVELVRQVHSLFES